jgi:hypothetical protein
MSTLIWRKFGLALIAISALSGTIMALAPPTTGYTQISEEHHGDSNFWYSFGVFQPTKVTTFWHPYWHRLVPSFALMAAGIACLAWPSRKPPRMTS